MNTPSVDIMLPVEILHKIAATSPQAYRAMLSMPPFARSLDSGTVTDYMIHFGHTVTVTRDTIVWHYRGRVHRLDGPAFEIVGGAKYWYKHGKFHRIGGPAIEFDDKSGIWIIDGVFIGDRPSI